MTPAPREARAAPVPIQRTRVAPAVGSPPAGLRGSGEPLAASTRTVMGAIFDHDFSGVRTHIDRSADRAARGISAAAVARGRDIAFAAGRHETHSASGRELLAHELAHVVQQAGGQGGRATSPDALEAEADRAATFAARGERLPFPLSAAGPGVQRRIELRDVGRREHSGLARLPELIDRLNAISTALIFDNTAGVLTYTENPYGTMTEFDRRMKAFIDSGTVLPLRFTNRHGLGQEEGLRVRIVEDQWSSGYVDIDDLLASSDLGLLSVLLHFISERNATPNYARRIGSPSLDTRFLAIQRELDRAHQIGINAERALLQDFFRDPTIAEVPGAESGNIFRVYRNSRRDRIRTRVTRGRGAERGVEAVTLDVVTRDGQVHTPEEYRDILDAARAAAAPAAPPPVAAP